MKLHASLLEQIVELPTKEPGELRKIFDDLGLEVKDIEETENGPLYNIETLANRADHTYALGIAREFSARFFSKLNIPKIAPELSDRKPSVPVRNLTEKCLRYGLLEMALPDSMSPRKDLTGFLGGSAEKHHPIVDLLNYILLELGQPMHAFDRDKVEGEISIVVSDADEEVQALDGKAYKVPRGSILICDRKRTIAVAGIIGCSNSMVTEDTKRVLIESASFDPVYVRKTARGMGISTDASYLYERGCDVDMVVFALKRLVVLADGSAGAVQGALGAHVLGFSYIEKVPTEKRRITLRTQTLKKQLNAPKINDIEVSTRLKNLGYGVENVEKDLQISVPSWRLWDVKDENDLIEDFVRSYGLNNVRLELPWLDYDTPSKNEIGKLYDLIESPLLGNGFCEVITDTFWSQKDVGILEQLAPNFSGKLMGIKNSIEREKAFLKSSNILHLCRLGVENLRRGVSAFKVFEISRRYEGEAVSDREYEYEEDILTLCSGGRWLEYVWRKPEEITNRIFLFKGVVESIFAAFGVSPEFGSSKNPWLHPGYQAQVSVGRTVCGWFGLLHPDILASFDTKEELVYAEFSVPKMFKVLSEVKFTLPSDFPAIRRDLTFKLPLRSFAAKISQTIKTAGVENLAEVSIFDDFRRGEEDFRRVTYRLVFQNNSRTLEHSEVDDSIQRILAQVENKHHIQLAV